MEITADIAEQLTYFAVGREYEGWKVVAQLRHEDSRWESNHTLVIQGLNGGLYGADYKLGLTEDQESELFGCEDDEMVEFRPMEGRTKVITEYVYK